MRSLPLLALLCLVVPATATAGTTTRGNEQTQRQELKRTTAQCVARDRDRPGRDGVAKVECKISPSVPPVVDPTPLFLP